MGPDGLEYPGSPGPLDEEQMYLARGEDISTYRPIFTGDVFVDVPLVDLGESKTETVLVMQHPCALRTNGQDLVPRILTAIVRRHRPLTSDQWQGNYGKFPLPNLMPNEPMARRHQAALFDRYAIVTPDQLATGKRVLALSSYGVNLLMQRRVMNDTRTLVPTHMFHEVLAGPYEEAELLEEWAGEWAEAGLDPAAGQALALSWLREDLGEGVPTRQHQLRFPQHVSQIRRAMREDIRQRLRMMSAADDT